MPRRYVALLRAISHVPMKPFRAALEQLGFGEVESFGMSGNLIFSTGPTSAAALEAAIAAKLDKTVLVRTAGQIAAVARADPFRDRRDAAILFLAKSPSAAKREAFLALDPVEPKPMLRGTTLYFAGWVTVAGKRIDLEKALGPGTMRSSRIVARLAEKMS